MSETLASLGFSEKQIAFIEAEEARMKPLQDAWLEAHRNDTCEHCGAIENVKHYPTGSLARLTPLCANCEKTLAARTKSFWDGYYRALEYERSRPWWLRLFRPGGNP